MNLDLSSQIVLKDIAEELYNPKNQLKHSELSRLERISTNIYKTQQQGAEIVADTLEYEIKNKQANNETFVLCLGTGLSLIPVFENLIQKFKAGKLSFKNVIVFNAYEFYPLLEDRKNSTINQLRTNFLNHVDIPLENIYTIEGNIPQDLVQSRCLQYEQLIAEHGGIDFALLGIGRNGNIAANEPGSNIGTTTRLILLDELSRDEMTRSFGNKELVPSCAVTIGMATVMSSKKILICAWGENKADILQKAIEGQITDSIPASLLQTHTDTSIVMDIAAAGRLTRIVHPWLVSSCKWTNKLTRSALVWLCQKVGKPILKLTNQDYNEHGLTELLAVYGSAYNANIEVFNDLQHTITGWPGGKPNADDTYRPERALPFPKKVLVFSPHPDDDVISMGGTIRRLVKQEHEVHIAYQTSGNIAVGDEEVTRFMHFINGFNQLFANDADFVIKNKYKEIKEFISQKKQGDLDTRDVLTIKGLIRRGEARTACTYNNIPLNRVHFLDLPFYESGKVEKLPVSEKDVRIVQRLLQDIQPNQIYVAGDLADPHGTHKKCTDVVLAALQEEKAGNAKWLEYCRVWMYRGAWAEWEIENIEMCVPLSPEELRAKRNSILKHQSQMESAPFLGNDERLFWQRAEDRNRSTAKLYDDLGLASYEGMEAFVEYIV